MRIILLFIFFIPWNIFAQELPAPPWPIISDYGPRNIWDVKAGKQVYKWHWGIDYDGSMWNPIAAVEGGSITGITHVKEGWYLRVHGSKYWTYFHIFNDKALPIVSAAPAANMYELSSAILENPVSHSITPSRENIIIFWDDRINNKAKKILTPRNGWLIQTGISTAPYIMSGSTWALTTNTVNQGDIIAPMGNSGVPPSTTGDGSHLHLACSSTPVPIAPLFYDINPLYYVRHDTPTYNLSLLATAADSTLFHITGKPEAEQEGERIRLNINSTAGKDLDRVKAHLVTGEIPMEERVFDDSNLLAKIFYGGRPPSELESDPLPSYMTVKNEINRGSFSKTGVSPMGGVGTDDFYFVGFNTKLKPDGKTEALLNRDAKFPDGEYGLIMRAHSIRYNNLDYVAGITGEGVLVDNYRPYVATATIAEVDDLENPVYSRRWDLSGSVLKAQESFPDGPLLPGHTYNITATMSEYTDYATMRTQDGANIPVISGVDYAGTHNSEYTGEVTIPTGITEDKVVPLVIQGMDVAENPSNLLLKIDSGRTTIDPAQELTRGATGVMLGTGGDDTFHYLRIDAASPIIRYNRHVKHYQTLDESCAGRPADPCGTESQPINITYSSVPFSYADIGSGLKDLTIYKETLGVAKFYSNPYLSLIRREFANRVSMTIPDGKYVQIITDNLGHTTTMYFRIEPVSPRLEISSITMSPPFSTYSVYGVVVDTGSGLDYLRLSRGGDFISDYALVRGTTESVNYSFSNLNVSKTGAYVFNAQDLAENLLPWSMVQFVDSSEYPDAPGPVPGMARAVVHHVTGVETYGDQCKVTVTSDRNQLEIPIEYTLPNGDSLEVQMPASPTPPPDTEPVPAAVPVDQYLHGSIHIAVTQKCDSVNGQTICTDACRANLKGTTVSALLLANSVKIVRNGLEAPHFNLTFTPDWIDFTFRNPGWDTEIPSGRSPMFRSASNSGDSGTGPRMNVTPITPPAPAAGFVNYPPESPRAWQVETANVSYDGIDIKAYGLSDRLSDDDKARVRILRQKDGEITDVTTGIDVTSTSVLGATSDDCTSACVFTLVAPLDIFDKVGPITDLYADSSFELAGKKYVSSTTPLNITAVDISTDIYTISGVATTYYLIDVEPSAECLQTAYDPSAKSGTCANSVSSGPFTLPEGEHSVFYISKDKVGNYSEAKTAVISADGTAPVTELKINGAYVAPGAEVSATDADFITLIATDPVSNGLASGYSTTYFLIDISPEECDYSDWSGGVDGVGSCENPYYSGPLALPEGEHTLYYSSEDNTGNREDVKSVDITVVSTAAQTLLPIVPSSGPIGMPFTIEGAGFGTYSAGTTVVLIGGTTAPLTLWADTKIQGSVPGTLAAGQQPVSVRRGSAVLAELLPFTVTTPALYALTPSSGAIGLPFTITGENFGNYVANFTQVLLGGATMPLTLWTDTKIQGTIPGNLAVGEYSLVVERALNGGVVRTSSATFTLSNMQAFWLAPSSGPIGMPFTITGEGFGNYSAALAHVLLGNTTAPLTLWSDTKIQGTVPGSLTSGQYPVVVERRTPDGGFMQTYPMTFEVVTVDVASMTPVAGPIGLPFTIYGANFGNYVANLTRVLIGGATAPLSLWTATQIQGTIPGSLAAGEYPVVVERQLNGGVVSSTAMAFVVTTPAAFNITPSSGAIGVPFTINGASFGNYSAAYTGVLINGATVPLTLWTDTKIQGTIPGDLAAGQYPVEVARMTADGGLVKTSTLAFEVLGVNITSMTPVAGPIGMPFTIYGGNFGNYSAGNTKVLIGGTTAPLSLWTDTKIQGTIPGSLAAGDYDLVVERSLNGGVVRSSMGAFTVTIPVLGTIDPSTAAVIAPFTITGANFGNYVANSTKVLINGSTVPLTLWTDTKIQGKLPFLLNGTYPVQVQRNLNGGLVESGTAYITVAEPVISSMTPTSGAVGTVFNLYGSSFGPYDASQTRVTIGGVACALSLWTDTNIRGTVPSAISFGTYTVVAMRGQALSNELEYTVPGTFRVSMARPVSMLDGEFKLGEVYVYPNPAKGGKVPVFHVEVGLADSVKIKVFSVSGQSVLERTITGIPQAIDGKYAYEYAWEGHIASGVYYYTMEAEQAGKKLKAKGKFAVVR